MLRISDLTLEKAIEVFRSAEVTEIQLRDIANDLVVHGIGVAKKKPPFRKTPSANEHKPSSSKSMGLVAEEEDENDCEPPLFVGEVTAEVQIQNDECYVTLPVQGHLKRLKVDTGWQVNIMPLKELKKIEGDNSKMDLCNQKLVSYSEDNLKVLGIIKLPVKSKSYVEQELTFHVVETNQPGLLGLRSSQKLGLINNYYTPRWLSIISFPTSASGIIVLLKTP